MTQQITLIKDKILSDNYFTLHNITYDLTRKDGEVIRHKREVYDRGNGATILLYNAKKKSVVLIRQFRVATWVNGNESGQLIETCAGLLDNDEPEVCIRKEAIEVLELPFSQALEMIKTGEIRDGKTVLLLNYLQTSHLMD
ncbi:GDP-mannose pyrophosphatase NudK [Escherichia coli]|nr:GDP-mannose pyrophosphatase NudK [Escherichia coli]EGZ2140149.1 GDP-mannose pyrophosphatase NudK [Escherichia coli]EGZ8190745.1 GDP-mannose pyrophosphatase NudK [Escherichia coli]EHK7262012.1 GDP-mannose pyrophosphatase NudK [Escherichia coli]EHK9644416.1 GDP-mannose pyrophosphatase NudK [Escherichia coli]